MKKLKVLVLSLVVVLASCERDDICSEGTSTTPQLIIEFYDFANQENTKNVVRLTAYGEGLVTDDMGNPTQPETSSNATIVFNTNTGSIALPLKILNEGETENTGQLVTTRFVLESQTNLRLDDNTSTTSNEDIIEITYNSEFKYVSRACGFKSIFTNLDVSVDQADIDPWITSINVLQSTVENENTIHVQIFH